MKVRRYSRQRELIFEALQGTDEHPTAEMIYQWLKPQHPGLSLGTVYRNLKLMTEEGTVARLAATVDRYDAITVPHSHFECNDCGMVYDIPQVSYREDLNRLVAEQTGHQATQHELTFRGTCAQCTPKH